MRLRALCKLSTAIALVTSSATAFAADQAEQQETSDSGPSLDEIVVTAQRRAENLQKAALAITAVSADTLTRAAVTDTTALTRVAPALQIGTLSGPTTQFYVRGVGKFTANSLTDSAVSVNLDGVPLARDGAIQGLFYDLERVEVLKGPQGTLYGRNATGGAINLISAKPRLGELSGYVNAEYGNYDAVRLTGAINAPLGENTAIRIASTFSNRDGYYSDGTGDDRLRAVRVQLTTAATDDLKITIGGDYSHVGGKGPGATVQGLDRDKYIGMYDPRAGAVISTKFAPLSGSFLTPISGRPFSDNSYWGLYAQADLTVGNGTLTVIPAYREAKLRYESAGSSFPIRGRLDAKQTSIEARYASDDDKPLSYILGAFFLAERPSETPAFNQQVFSAFGTFQSKTDSYAGFARLTYKLSDTFRLSGGVRYTIDNKSAFLDAYNVVVVCPAFLAGGPPCIGTPPLPNVATIPSQFVLPNGNAIPVQPWGTAGAIVTNTRATNRPNRTFKKATYRVGFEYDAAPQSLIYGGFETGFKSGGFFNSLDNPVYEPETIDAFTLGSKNRFLDNRLQLNLELFWWTYKNQQVSHFRQNSVGGSEFVTENIGKTRLRGFEIESRARVASGTTLSATVQYLDSRNLDYVYNNPIQSGPPNTGCPVSASAGAFIVNCNGRRAVNAPVWSVNGGIEQVIDLGESGAITLNADGRYQSSTYTGFEQLAAMREPENLIIDLQAQYALPGGHFTIAGYVNNLTDKAVSGFSTPHPFSGSYVVQNLRPPRTYGVRMGYKF
ncbi:TonB-dependent receptor [Novosphingobium sp.]|uniref:TonB-dependent receptor n=1 Tax=Novosphingobium sp. TaxID=1874826 RepID=UPI003561AE28